jgi:thiamine biosynthesis lipoprotein
MTAPIRRYADHVMGMPVSLALRGRHAADDRGSGAWQEAFAALADVDRVFSTYRPDSFVSRYGRGEIGLGECPPEVAEVVRLGERAKAESGGAFDLWRRQGDGSVRFDPSGVVKGWAVERAVLPLRRLDETDFCLAAGGDMVCHVADPGAPAWTIGIEHPLDPARLIATVPVRDGAVATSGASHRGKHIRDARTGLPPAGVASVTVVAADLVRADVDATAAFARGRDALHWLEGRPGATGLVVWSDGSTASFAGRSCPSAA